MRSSTTFGMVLAAGLSLVACASKAAILLVRGPCSAPAGAAIAARRRRASFGFARNRDTRFAAMPDRGELLPRRAGAGPRQRHLAPHRAQRTARWMRSPLAHAPRRDAGWPRAGLPVRPRHPPRQSPATGPGSGTCPAWKACRQSLTFGAGAVYGEHRPTRSAPAAPDHARWRQLAGGDRSEPARGPRQPLRPIRFPRLSECRRAALAPAHGPVRRGRAEAGCPCTALRLRGYEPRRRPSTW